jgi:hypothetical protein
VTNFRRYGAIVALRVVALAAALLFSTTCQFTDLLKPSGLERIEVAYASDSVLVVAAPTRPSVTVKVNGATFAGARLLVASSDSNVVAVHGDTLVPKQRGTATLTISLLGSTLPRSAPGLVQKLSVVADTVTVDSASVRLVSLGDTVTLAATARDALGAAIAGATAHWASSDTNLVTVTPAGRLAAKANGTTTVRAMVDRDTALVPVTVAQVLTKWTLEPASLRIDALTATGSVVATGHDARGNAIAALAPASWSVGDATIASVSAAGDVTALKNGATWLLAVRGAVRDSVPVTVAQRATLVTVTPKPPSPVTSLGAQVQLTARAFDRKAIALQGAAPSWLTLDPGLARVGTDGLVTALAIGTAHVVAALDQAADTVGVVISNDPASIAIAPDSALATSVGDTLVFRAIARNGRGDSVAATFAWRTPDSSVVNLLADGRAVALAVGAARVIATVGGKADTGLAKVTNVPTEINITPATRTYMSLGDVDTLPVTITNARGAALPRGSVTWTSDDATIARVNAGGIVTARDTGQTVVRAASGVVHDSVLVTVQNEASTLAIQGARADTLVALGQSVACVAEVRNARGATIPGYQIAWTARNPGVVRVGSDGVATAAGVGTTFVIATADAASDSVAVVVRNDPVSVSVAPDSALATSVGDTLIFRATARNARGDTIPAPALVWQTPDTAIVRLLADGRAIAQATGTARVIVTAGTNADTGLARVTNIPAAIDIGPATRTYASLGDVDTLPVTITNARGAALSRGSVTWSSDDATIARVSTSGVVTARDTGQTVVRAATGVVDDSVVVTVQNLPASIVVNSPPVDTLTAIGQTLTLLADVRNARGAQILNFPVAWRSTNRAAVDTVLPTGAALAIGWGTTILIAQAGTAADTVTLTVRNPTRLYVSNALFTGLRVGTTARPYARIQDAVNAADAGDTVIVFQGSGSYSESVALLRRITILGDSTAFKSGGRNPLLLPLLAHDTGAAAITAYTTAPVLVKYLAIRHTLDGPAFAGDGSDAQLEWLYVNPAFTGVATRIGRGVLISNSQAGSLLKNLRIRSVRGFGISLVNSSTATISGDSIAGVDSIGIAEGGAGISLRGGASNTVTANAIRATRGPRILVRGAASATITNHALSGRHPLIHIDSVTGLVQISGNTFQIAIDADYADDPNCQTDTRCAGVVITNSPAGALIGGGTYFPYATPVDIRSNTFYTSGGGFDVRTDIGIRVRRSTAFGGMNSFRYVQAAHQTEEGAKAYFFQETADTSGWMGVVNGADSLRLENALTHEAGAVFNYSEPSQGPAYIYLMFSHFSQQSGNLVNIWDSGTSAGSYASVYTCTPNNQAVFFYGNALTSYGDTVRGSGDTVPGYRAGAYYSAGFAAIRAPNGVSINNTVIRDFTYLPGLLLYGDIGVLYASQTVLTRNQVGLRIDGTVLGSMSLSGNANNSIFDNLVGGLQDNRISPTTSLANWWWGDGRGPRGAGNPSATGDSVLAGLAPFSPLGSPPQTGTVAAAIRHVRGTGQTAVHGATLPKALTARVVDALGLPVVGVSVTFTVTGGGGNLGGLTTRTVTTNTDGLAEGSLTLGAAAGANTVTATGTGLGTVTFAETGT